MAVMTALPEKEALNAHMCVCQEENVCPDICHPSTSTMVCEPVQLMFRHIREVNKTVATGDGGAFSQRSQSYVIGAKSQSLPD